MKFIKTQSFFVVIKKKDQKKNNYFLGAVILLSRIVASTITPITRNTPSIPLIKMGSVCVQEFKCSINKASLFQSH